MTDKNIDITNKLKSILNSIAEAKNIKHYTVFPDTNREKGNGFLSEFYTGKVVNEENGNNIDVGIKIAPEKGFIDSQVIYKNEVHFYSQVFPELDKFQKAHNVNAPFDNIPIFLSGSVKPKEEFVAMEHLRTENYKSFEKPKYIDSEHFEYIFKTYGKFHALSFIFKQQNKEKYENLMKGFSDAMGKLVESPGLQYQFREVYEAALKTFDTINEGDIIAKLKKIDDINDAVSKARKYTGKYSCLLHGDCWSNNLLFKYQKSGAVENLKLIDFQLCYGSTPVHDLSYLFYSGASKADMDKLDYYIKLYHKSLCDFAKELRGNVQEVFSLEDLHMEWKEYSLFGLLFGMHVWIGKLMNHDALLDVLSQENLPKEKYAQVWGEALRKSRESDAFKERARNICIHAAEYGII